MLRVILVSSTRCSHTCEYSHFLSTRHPSIHNFRGDKSIFGFKSVISYLKFISSNKIYLKNFTLGDISPSRACPLSPGIFQFSSRVHLIFRLTASHHFAVKSSRGGCGHSRSQTRWSQTRLSLLENLCIKKHNRPSDPSKFHRYTCRQGAKNYVRVQVLVSKKFYLWA